MKLDILKSKYLKKIINYLVSDNYGEYTSINMDKTIDEEKLTQILDSIFIKEA